MCAHLASHRLAQPQAQPAQLGQLDPVVHLIQFELLRIGEPQARLIAELLELREPTALLEEALVGLVEPLEHLLLRVNRRVPEPRSGERAALDGEPATHVRVGSVLLASCVPRSLLGQCAVPHLSSQAGVPAQHALARRTKPKLKAVGTDTGHL